MRKSKADANESVRDEREGKKKKEKAGGGGGRMRDRWGKDS